MKKFTFKTEKSTGRYRSFYPDTHIVKYNKIDIGQISDKEKHKISLRVIKDDIAEDGNTNCEWKTITFKAEFKTIQEAKEFLNNNIEQILEKYKFPTE